MTRSTFLERIGNLLERGSDRISTARAIVDALRRKGGYRWTGLYDVDSRAGLVSNIAWSGAGAPEHPTFPVCKGLTSRAIREKRTINVGDVTKDPDYLTALVTTRSEIIVPVVDIMHNSVVGTMDVESELPNAFDAVTQSELEECAILVRSLWSRF
jgi:putative methionine-R-sulfoxide reductase with GAF domain